MHHILSKKDLASFLSKPDIYLHYPDTFQRVPHSSNAFLFLFELTGFVLIKRKKKKKKKKKEKKNCGEKLRKGQDIDSLAVEKQDTEKREKD